SPIRQLLIESSWRQVAPSVLVLIALAVVGYVGHRTGWKVPRFSELFGASRADESSWCNEQNVPEAECIACHAELMPKGKLFGWCVGHGVLECVLCHPELAQLTQPATVTDAAKARIASALAVWPRAANNRRC